MQFIEIILAIVLVSLSVMAIIHFQIELTHHERSWPLMLAITYAKA